MAPGIDDEGEWIIAAWLVGYWLLCLWLMSEALLAAGSTDVPIIIVKSILMGKMAVVQRLLRHFYCLNIAFILLDLNKHKSTGEKKK